jgi:hypothetical protein
VQTDYTTISAALAAATDWDFILVQDGTYNENDLDFAGKIVTLRSEYGSASTIIDCGGVGRAFIFQSGETANSELDGFTIINGSATKGGGILCEGASPTLRNLIIQNCEATGGSFLDSGGGGISCDNGSSPTIEHCIIRDNDGRQGGGIQIRFGASTAQVINCLIANNSGQWCGGVYFADCDPAIISCTIANNTASSGGGGGIGVEDTTQPGTAAANVYDTIFWGNTASAIGHQIALWTGASITLDYCCYANGANDIDAIGGTFTPTNCTTSDPGYLDVGVPGPGGGGDFHLKPGTLCFNGGSNAYVTWSKDLDGNDRIRSVHVDIGVYEQGYINVPNDYGTIGAAIAAATDLDLILVEDGTYNETGLDFGGLEIAVRSENGPAGCIIDCQSAGRAFIFQSGETNDSVLEGFTIQNGLVSNDNGGTILCASSSSPVIRNCVIDNCQATGTWPVGGGGIHCDNSDPAITGCSLVSDYADQYGGAVCCHNNASPTITDCTIAGNTAAGGGGISCYFNSPAIPAITNCVISGNVAGDGGGVGNWDSPVMVVNCLFEGNNTINLYGGGMYNWGANSSATVNNCTFIGNMTPAGGGAIHNRAGGIVTTVTDCILWGNVPNDIANTNGAICNVSFSCVTGGYAGPGNIGNNPLFVAGYYLSQIAAGQGADSPCLNTGSNTAANLGMDDKTTRTDSVTDAGQVDMGYHYEP